MSNEKFSEYKINSYEDRKSDKGKVLKTCFLNGPSKAVIKYGSVEVTGGENENQENKESTDQSADKKGNESYSYSIFDSFMNMQRIYEDGVTGNDTFRPGTIRNVRVKLTNEGHSDWVIQFDARVGSKVEAAVSAIKSKDFKKAYLIASEGLESDGLVPLSITTFYHTDVDADKHTPSFIGHCQYGFDSGLSSRSNASVNAHKLNVTIAIAPINGETNKTSANLVMQYVYNVTGDITSGALSGLVKAYIKYQDATSRDSYYDEDKLSDEMSKYLNKVFKCAGDQSMYDKYQAICNFIEKQIKAKNLEYEGSNLDSKSAPGEIKFNADNKLIYF
jgi:hypothetical protein